MVIPSHFEIDANNGSAFEIMGVPFDIAFSSGARSEIQIVRPGLGDAEAARRGFRSGGGIERVVGQSHGEAAALCLISQASGGPGNGVHAGIVVVGCIGRRGFVFELELERGRFVRRNVAIVDSNVRRVVAHGGLGGKVAIVAAAMLTIWSGNL